jgi:hypothetical protein
MDNVLICSNCRSKHIKIMWNLKASLVDDGKELQCKVNSEIMEKIMELSPTQGLMEFLRDPEGLKALILKKMHLLKGVFKISAKQGGKKEG